MAMTTQGTQLLYGTAAGSLTELCRIKDFGDLIGDPNLVDATDLTDKQQVNLLGVLTSDVITFAANYESETYAGVAEKANTPAYYALRFKDGSGFTWQGQHSCGVPGKGVDDVLEFTINIVNSSAVEHSESITIGGGGG